MDHSLKKSLLSEEIIEESKSSCHLRVPTLKQRTSKSPNSSSVSSASITKKERIEVSQIIVNYPKDSKNNSFLESIDSIKLKGETQQVEEIKSEKDLHRKEERDLTKFLSDIEKNNTLHRLVFDKNIDEIAKIIEGNY